MVCFEQNLVSKIAVEMNNRRKWHRRGRIGGNVCSNFDDWCFAGSATNAIDNKLPVHRCLKRRTHVWCATSIHFSPIVLICFGNNFLFNLMEVFFCLVLSIPSRSKAPSLPVNNSYPSSQEHSYPPGVFLHFCSQPPLLFEHSSMSKNLWKPHKKVCEIQLQCPISNLKKSWPSHIDFWQPTNSTLKQAGAGFAPSGTTIANSNFMACA